MITSKGEKALSFITYIIISLVALLCVYPFWYVLIASLSESNMVITGKVFLLPQNITTEAYKLVLSQDGIWTAYANTIFYTVVGTGVSLFFTVCGAYPLSKKRLFGRSFFSFYMAFTMWFGAGVIPFYLNLRDFNLLNTRLGVILPFAVATFYVILMRTYFQSIPEALEESAKIDGASDFSVLWTIYLPLSLPAMATIGLYYAVSRWNGYFWSMIILTDESKIPLQVLLTKLIINLKNAGESFNAVDTYSYSQETIIYATIIVSIIPIMLVYPYIQKYFVKGIMVGSVKG